MKRHHVFVVIAALAAACGGGGAATDSTTTTTSSTAVGTVTETTSASTTTSTVADDALVRVSAVLADGTMTVTVDGEPLEGRIMVRLGDEVTIDFISDVTEELHVHGYDMLLAASPGQPATDTFVADIPGIFEVEQHFAGHLTVFTIQVQ
jgi:hypothetical protein